MNCKSSEKQEEVKDRGGGEKKMYERRQGNGRVIEGKWVGKKDRSGSKEEHYKREKE